MSLKGMDEMVKKFQMMSKIDTKEVKKLTNQGAGIILASAKQKCTSLTVRKALGFVTKNDNKYPTTTLIGLRPEYAGNLNGGKTLTVPAHAAILEYGTTERFKKDGSSTGYVAPKKFMRPALDENKDKVTAVIKDGLIELINKQYNK